MMFGTAPLIPFRTSPISLPMPLSFLIVTTRRCIEFLLFRVRGGPLGYEVVELNETVGNDRISQNGNWRHVFGTIDGESDRLAQSKISALFLTKYFSTTSSPKA